MGHRRFAKWLTLCALTLTSCSGPELTTDSAISPTAAITDTAAAVPSPTVTTTATPTIVHVVTPGEPPSAGRLSYDVVSKSTAPDGRAPYGDSYEISLFERPFLQDMTYVPDLDIFTFTVTKDDTFWYVSVELVGSEPNNPLGIHYALELDRDYDGHGDHIIWGSPPYPSAWDTRPVSVFADKNGDTGGLSAERADAPLSGDGYEVLEFQGGMHAPDPDIAWMRVHAGQRSTLQFAFKRDWSGMIFMLGVIADAGIAEVSQMDYVDRLPAAEAGSPVRDNDLFPLGALFAVDNTCREAFGREPKGVEPRICPDLPPPDPDE